MKKPHLIVIIACAVIAAAALVEAAREHVVRISGTPGQATPATTTISSDPAFAHKVHVPILIYHSVEPLGPDAGKMMKQFTVTPDQFEKQLAYLHDNGYAVVSLESVVKAIRDASGTVPEKSVVLTFDDGWENQFTYAYPLLQKYNDTATFFVFTNGMMSKNKGFMTWDQVRELNNAGMSVESHSVSHPYLFAITDPTQLAKEIAGSKEIIEKHVSTTVDLFAYPFGKWTDQDIAELQSTGYLAARTDVGGASTTFTNADLYTMNGIQVTNDFKRFVRFVQK